MRIEANVFVCVCVCVCVSHRYPTGKTQRMVLKTLADPGRYTHKQQWEAYTQVSLNIHTNTQTKAYRQHTVVST